MSTSMNTKSSTSYHHKTIDELNMQLREVEIQLSNARAILASQVNPHNMTEETSAVGCVRVYDEAKKAIIEELKSRQLNP